MSKEWFNQPLSDGNSHSRMWWPGLFCNHDPGKQEHSVKQTALWTFFPSFCWLFFKEQKEEKQEMCAYFFILYSNSHQVRIINMEMTSVHDNVAKFKRGSRVSSQAKCFLKSSDDLNRRILFHFIKLQSFSLKPTSTENTGIKTVCNSHCRPIFQPNNSIT